MYVELTFDGEVQLTVDGKPYRSFVNLPEPLTRFNPTTNQIWVDDIGPMTSGDLVLLSGGISEGKRPKRYEGACVAYSETTAVSMRPWTWDPRELYTPRKNVQARQLLNGIWPYDTKKNYSTVEIFVGTLVLEEPCVYIELSLDGHTQHTVEGELVRSFVKLPDSRTFYSPTTSRIWTSGTTPMNNGDPILIHGTMSETTNIQTYEDVCLAHSETTAVSMELWSGR